jgi:hypothetical protein
MPPQQQFASVIPDRIDGALRLDAMMGDRERLQARAMELGIPYVDLDRVRLDEEIKTLLPLEVLQRLQVLPLKRDGRCVWVASGSPGQKAAFEEVKELTGCRVFPVLAMPDLVRQKIVEWADELAR